MLCKIMYVCSLYANDFKIVYASATNLITLQLCYLPPGILQWVIKGQKVHTKRVCLNVVTEMLAASKIFYSRLNWKKLHPAVRHFQIITFVERHLKKL